MVQHITRGFTSGLAAWLNTTCRLRVKLAEDGEPRASHSVVPGSGRPAHRRLQPVDNRPVGRGAGRRLSAVRNLSFRVGCASLRASAVAVILTGMGDDGVAGLRAVRQAGGRIIAQDEESCVVFGMPGAAVAAGVTDQVLSLDKIAPRLVQLCQ